MKSEPDVIVIGGGVAGLAAAGELSRSGWRVRLIEARERLGGRILSVQAAGWRQPVELGAEFLHGGNHALKAIIKRSGVRLRSIAPKIWRVEKGVLQPMPDYWERIARVAGRIPWRDHGWSFRQFLWHYRNQISRDDRQLTTAYVSSFNAAPAGVISAHALRDHRAGADAEDAKIAGRYDAIVRGLRQQWARGRVDLCLETVATEIRWRRGEVVVRTRGGRGAVELHRGRAAVITLPLGVLKAGRVKFSPRLVGRESLIKRAGWGHVVRIVIHFRAGFWTAPFMPAPLGAVQGRDFGFVHAPSEAVPVWWSLTPPAPILTGWLSGDAAARVRPGPPRAMFEQAVGSLANIFRTSRREINRRVMDWVSHDWRHDPFALGAYSFPVAGEENIAERLAEPMRDTLFFAGEALAKDYGTVHGAIESGLLAGRAAAGVLDAALIRQTGNPVPPGMSF